MAKIRPQSYSVLITPLIAKDTYGDEIDVTEEVSIEDYVKEKGISSILREVDNGDFDFGVFVYNSITLTCINFDGKFSIETDSRSMFKYTRDKAKIKINFYDGTSNTPAISFRGLIDDRATKQDFNKDEVKLTVLSQDSILNRLKFLSGSVPEGALCSTAIKKILERPDITSVLNYDQFDINVANDYVIDDISWFEEKILKEILDALMVITNSILFVDKDNNIIVRNREHNSEDVFELFGEGDLLGRQNIIAINEFNSGLQRTFNTVTFGEQFSSEPDYAAEYGDNKKNIDYDFITNEITRASICRDIVDHFKMPKIEMVVTCKTSEVSHLGFFDLVSVDYPYRRKPLPGLKLPMYGSAIYGESRYPYISGSLKISSNMAFKIIGIEEDPQTFHTKLKLRQVGTSFNDGWFSTMVPNELPARYGFAIYGINKYTDDGL